MWTDVLSASCVDFNASASNIEVGYVHGFGVKKS